MIKIYTFLEKQENNFWFKMLFAPIWCILEYICFLKIWKKHILPELVTNDEIFSFFDKNDFAYQKNKFIKKDLVDEQQKLSGHNLEEVKYIVKQDYIEAFTKKISENCSTNIEDFITLIVNAEMEVRSINNEYYKSKIYTVIIQYCRLWWLQKAKQYTIFWLLSIGTIIVGLITILSYIK